MKRFLIILLGCFVVVSFWVDIQTATAPDRVGPRGRPRYWSGGPVGGRPDLFVFTYAADDLDIYGDGDTDTFLCDKRYPGRIFFASPEFWKSDGLSLGRLSVGTSNIELRPTPKGDETSWGQTYQTADDQSFFDLLRSGDMMTFELQRTRNTDDFVRLVDSLTGFDALKDAASRRSQFQIALKQFEDACATR